jgi:hypothetical protein
VASAPVLGPADDDPEPFFASFDQAAARDLDQNRIGCRRHVA